jgi:two-component system response regulator AtoC
VANYAPEQPFENKETKPRLPEKGRQMDNRRTSPRSPQTQNQYLVGNSPATQQVRERIRQAVEANVDTILLTGETGTGKEVVAREIHFQGCSEECPFVAVNCSALPKSLVESELFGHVKGAFTDATTDRAGYFEMANSGTLFLDEIADLAVHIQAKLLRILETRTLIRVGDTQEASFQERVISAFNRDPVPLVKSGQFRSDLFHRLNVFPIHLTPLRERPEDILPLADHFLEAYTAKSGRIFDDFSERAKSILVDYPYPGNVRELRNIVERTTILCPPEVSLIGAEHLDIQGNATEKLLSQSDISAGGNEYKRILRTLEENRWNRRRAAKKLGIPYSTLLYKINTLGLSQVQD